MSDTKFYQANKKDARIVTAGSYTMSTTKKGKYLNRTRPYEVRLKKMWKMDAEVGRLVLNYRMGHTLEDMGITLKPIDWTKTHSQRTSSTGSEYSEENLSVKEQEAPIDSSDCVEIASSST